MLTFREERGVLEKLAKVLMLLCGGFVVIGIIYLMFTPLTIAGFLGYRWWLSEKAVKDGKNEKND